MTDWFDRLLNEPMRDNPYAFGLLVIILLGWAGPLLFMMGRDMWRRKKETRMSDAQDAENYVHEVPITDEGPLFVADAPTDLVSAEEWAAKGWVDLGAKDTTEVLSFGGTVRQASVPTPLVSNERVDCEHCGGRGFVPGINDLLKDSVALLGDDGDEVVRLFYTALLRTAPDLAPLFPGSLLDPSPGTAGATQRDRLLKALVALANLYDPGDGDKMTHLDQALATFGRSHAAFVRKDGTIRGATLDEYAAVKDALFSTLVRVVGEHWRPEFTEAWSQAYDYAAAVMLTEQFRSGFSAPRFARA